MRGVPRWFAVVAVLAVVAVVGAFTARRAMAPTRLVAQLALGTLAADGFSSTELTIRSADGRALRGVHVEVADPHRLSVDSLSVADGLATASLRAGVLPGETELRISADGVAPQEIALKITPDDGDSVGDGTPDFLRLHDPADRQAFRRWFTLLAEAQYFRGKPQPEVDDCAALLRFAYREALREHDAAWAHAMALPAPAAAGDVQQYQYPFTPLAAEIFRVRGGSFTEADLRDGAFAQFADAETLWRHNTFSVGRDLQRARPGDLLFFRQNDAAGHMPFHAMIFVGRSQVEPPPQRAKTARVGDPEARSEQFVVYHTGPSGGSAGEVRRMSVAQLLDYPDPRWRPVTANPAFLGVYRWNILRGGE